MEMTFGIIKPDAVKKGNIGAILNRINEKGFKVVAMKMIQMSASDAGGFYEVHKERPFYNDLVEFMISGPVVVMALEKNDAVKGWRDLMGATNPKEAAEGTIRKDFAESIDANAVHGSDSLENAAIEVSYFFSKTELVNQ
ncbi:MAG: nucleoside-diphosphate kinase [Nitrospinae bacterium]|nr:nucleoside-diphosphate kinase [Nitrospinota bacterium]